MIISRIIKYYNSKEYYCLSNAIFIIEIGFSIKGRYLNFGKLIEGTKLTIKYPLKEGWTKEKIGGNGNSTNYTSADQKPTYTVRWKGNRIVSMQQKGNLLPIFAIN